MARLESDQTSSHTPLIVELPEDCGEGAPGPKTVVERLQAGRKRARKLRQRMASRYAVAAVGQCGRHRLAVSGILAYVVTGSSWSMVPLMVAWVCKVEVVMGGGGETS